MTPDELRAARRRLNMRQEDLANALGVSRDAVKRWEAPPEASNRRTPPAYLRLAIASLEASQGV
jgi:DNA-binding transcriptional regulator YiaG